MSIGYRVKSAEKRNGIRYIAEIDVMEASVVTVPANPQARVSAIKESDPDLESRRAQMRRLHIQQLARRRA
jgi:phage head maturation protease